MLKIVKEVELEDFEAWGGGEDTLNHIINEGGVKLLQSILEEEYPEGLSEESLNDILRHESEWCYKMANVSDPDEVEESDEDENELSEDEQDSFNEFCGKYESCDNCPFVHCKTIHDCESNFIARYLT